MTIKQLNNVLYKVLGMKLDYKEREFIWETFKVKTYIEDNPDNLDEREVSL
jgi:hypothetical protein